MPKYYDTIDKCTTLSQSKGHALSVSPDFQILSSTILSQCVFLQSQIQQIIYISHGTELLGAKRILKNSPSPKDRVNFLCSFPYSRQDPIIAKVFDFSRLLFSEIYEVRNVLAHEVWSSSEDYPGFVLFSNLDENSRLLMASSRLWHEKDTTPKDIFDATIRFIRSIKVVSCDHLRLAVDNISLCSWSLMNICNVLNEDDLQRREEARRAFLVFQGTSHLFGDNSASSEPVVFHASRQKRMG